MDSKENPLNGRRDTAVKVLCSSSNVPFIVHQSQTNLQYFRPWGLRARFVSGKCLKWKRWYSQQVALCFR